MPAACHPMHGAQTPPTTHEPDTVHIEAISLSRPCAVLAAPWSRPRAARSVTVGGCLIRRRHPPVVGRRFAARRGAAPKPVQHVVVLAVVDVILKEERAHLEEGRLREERVGSRLVLGSDALHLKLLGQLGQPALEVFARAHHVLDVEDVRAEEQQLGEEVVLLGGQRLAREELHDVREIISRVESDPAHLIAQHDARAHQELREVRRLDPPFLVPTEVDARARKEIDRVLRVDVVVEGELEVELVRAHIWRELAVLIAQREAELDDLQEIDVATDRLVVKVRGRLEVANRPRNHTGELGVHRDVWVVDDHVAYDREFTLHVIRPNVTDKRGGRCAILFAHV
eukprot:CAMPEP_0119376206 /NCGR_PEP_ID=MMETSP1334-20130426/39513_1 /TAXON_ID=127549 /ORGANISM="Calcidiscus leptoporus, Strain RCC1130" /LENGTH=341 /DNA_ID=CAMNT_0007394727 /DNA_START=40 /DNA_END=1065 /DNA_ORIENTATION=+